MAPAALEPSVIAERLLITTGSITSLPTLSSGAAVNIYGAERTDQGFRRDRTHLTIGGL